MISLRRRLLVLLLGGLAAVWVVTALLSYRDARHEIDELFDANLAQAANTLAALAGHDAEDVLEDLDLDAHKYLRRIVVQVWDEDGRLLLHSANAPHEAMARREGFSDAEWDGRRWRVFSRSDRDAEITVQVAEQFGVREELARHVAFKLLWPLAFALPLLALLVWWSVASGLRPIGRVTGELGKRDPGNLAPLDPGAAPVEVRPLVEALNALLERLARALESERRFTADAAHELRTPLAALKVHAQVAQRTADEARRRAALEQVVQGVDRATRLTEQLLTLARLDPEQGLPLASLDAAALCRDAAAALSAAAQDKGVALRCDAAEPAMAMAEAESLAILLRNLLDNAVRYTPSGGEVEVSCRESGDAVEITVRDSGPGIPAAERERVLGRFQRVLGSGESGSGLGLSIVKRIADLHRAALSLGDAEGGGLLVGLRLARAVPH